MDKPKNIHKGWKKARRTKRASIAAAALKHYEETLPLRQTMLAEEIVAQEGLPMPVIAKEEPAKEVTA